MSDCRYSVSPVNCPDPDPDGFMMGVKNNKFYFVCIVKTQVDKVMASVKKGVKYMVIISSNTNSLSDTSHN